MPAWLGALLRDWWPVIAGVTTFVVGLAGAAGRGLYSLFANGTIVSKSRHQAEMDFFREQLRLTQEAADRRIAELRQDVADLTADRDSWRDRFWKAADAGQILIRRDTPPRGIHRSEIGP